MFGPLLKFLVSPALNHRGVFFIYRVMMFLTKGDAMENKRVRLAVSVPLLLLILSACTGCEADIGTLHNMLTGKDRNPPVLLSVQAVSPTRIVCRFNEPVRCDEAFQWKLHGATPAQLITTENEISVISNETIPRGEAVVIEGRVRDEVGNSTWFTSSCWGHNAEIPSLLINEFTTKGTDANPDRTELSVLSDGNLAGITLSDGPEDLWAARIVLPSQRVRRGDFVVIWWKGSPLEAIGHGEDGSGIYSYALPESPGLPGNNGVLVLTSTPAPSSKILDAIVYTNRTTSTFDGFGSKELRQKVEKLVESGHWKPATQTIDARCGIDSTYSTATRSICRTPGGVDTDGKEDWHVTPTRGATLGAANTKEQYSP